VQLLGYFGEASDPCGNCDNCLEPPELWDATEAARKLLSCIYRCERASGFGFAATHIIDVLRGKETEKTRKFGHEALSTFGIGADLPEAEWRLLLRQLVALHLVEVDHETFNVLRLTDASRPVLKGERKIELRRHIARPARNRRKAASATALAAMTSADSALFERLRGWRAEVAKQHGVPAYVVFHDGTLRESIEGNLWVAQRVIPDIGALRVIRSWATIGVMIDGAPNNGELPGVPGFFSAVGANGYTMGPIVGRVIAQLATTGEQIVDIRPFRPDRFH
jgi:ATP-dependent DNA helicase RecQ